MNQQNTPSLPGSAPTAAPTPALPNTTQVGPRPIVPASWTDKGRIMAQILEVFDKGGATAANELSKWCKDKLEKISAGK